MRIRRIAKEDTEAFEAALLIYRASIDASERKPDAWLAAMLARPDYAFLLIDIAERPAAMAVVYVSPTTEFWLLEYLAVAPDQRGGGIGSEVLSACVAFAFAPVGLIEVDALLEEAPGADLRRKRLAFYQRQGCRQLGDIAYEMPPVTPATPPPMVMLAIAPQSVASIDAPTVRRWLNEIYVRVYNQLADAPAIDRIMRGQPDLIPLRLSLLPPTP